VLLGNDDPITTDNADQDILAGTAEQNFLNLTINSVEGDRSANFNLISQQPKLLMSQPIKDDCRLGSRDSLQSSEMSNVVGSNVLDSKGPIVASICYPEMVSARH
jgi:hypothetical protein